MRLGHVCSLRQKLGLNPAWGSLVFVHIHSSRLPFFLYTHIYVFFFSPLTLFLSPERDGWTLFPTVPGLFLPLHCCLFRIPIPRGVNQPIPSTRQGTVGLELVQQVKELTGGAALDAVIVPIGGGGLISGVTTAVKSLCPGIRVIGAEPQKAANAFRSKQVLQCFFQ